MSQFGLPGSAGSLAPRNLPGNQGYFSVPLGVQRLFEHSIYSTNKYAAGGALGSDVLLFSVAVNQAGLGFAVNSISETNIQVAGMAPGGESYEITAISCEIFGDGAVAPLVGDVRLFQRVTVLHWQFGMNLILPISPLSMIGCGGGIQGFSADTATPVTVANNGVGIWQYANVAVSIPATQPYGVILRSGTAGTVATRSPVAITDIRVALFNFARNAVPIA